MPQRVVKIGRHSYNVLEWSSKSVGRELEEVWDYEHWRRGMGEQGYLHTENVDLTGPRLRLPPTIRTIAVATLPTGQRTVPFWESGGGSGHYVYLAVRASATSQRIYKIKTSENTIAEDRTLTLAGSTDQVPQAVAFMQGNWYKATHVSPGHVRCLEQLTTVATPPTPDTWTAHDTAVVNGINFILATESSDGTQVLMRYDNVSGQGKVRLATAGFLVESNWKGNFDLGASAAIATGMVNAPIAVIARRDNIYAFDRLGNSKALTDTIGSAGANATSAGGLDVNNGYGTTTWGTAIILYPHRSGLFLISNFSRTSNISPTSLPGFKVLDEIDTFAEWRHYETVTYGPYSYSILSNEYNASVIIQGHFRETELGLGPEVIWHTAVFRSGILVRGLFIDKKNMRLWWAEPGQDRVAYIQLTAGGSLDSGDSRGAFNSTFKAYSDRRHFEDPKQRVQLRTFSVQRENFGNNEIAVQPQVYRDNGAVEAVGPPIGEEGSGWRHNEWPLDKSSLCYELRSQLTLTTTANWGTGPAPGTVSIPERPPPSDARIVRWVIRARPPSIETVVIEVGRDDVNILRGLVGGQPLEVHEPYYNEPFLADVLDVRPSFNSRDEKWTATVIFARYEVRKS